MMVSLSNLVDAVVVAALPCRSFAGHGWFLEQCSVRYPKHDMNRSQFVQLDEGASTVVRSRVNRQNDFENPMRGMRVRTADRSANASYEPMPPTTMVSASPNCA